MEVEWIDREEAPRTEPAGRRLCLRPPVREVHLCPGCHEAHVAQAESYCAHCADWSPGGPAWSSRISEGFRLAALAGDDTGDE